MFGRQAPAPQGYRSIFGDEGFIEQVNQGAAIKAAYNAVKDLLDAGNFKGAAEALKQLKGATLKGVLERILGSAGKATSPSVTVEQLTGIVEGSLKQIGQAALDIMKGQKGFKAGKWEPKNQPKGMYVGSEIHRAIARRYTNLNPGDAVFTNDISVGRILKDGFKINPKSLNAKEAGLQPDIFNVTKKHLYEIKPENLIANAVIERDVYTSTFANAGVTVQHGPMTALGANGVVEAPGGYAMYYSPLPGVILYRRKTGDFDPAKVPLPVAGRAPVEETSEDLEPQQPSRTGVPAPALASESQGDVIDYFERATGLTGVALLLYLIVSEGSRVFPPRNLIPLP